MSNLASSVILNVQIIVASSDDAKFSTYLLSNENVATFW